MQTENLIPIYESKHASNIAYFVKPEKLTDEAAKAYENGDVYGAYETTTGRFYATLKSGGTIKNIVKK